MMQCNKTVLLLYNSHGTTSRVILPWTTLPRYIFYFVLSNEFFKNFTDEIKDLNNNEFSKIIDFGKVIILNF